MPEPTQTPTAEEIVTFAEITGVSASGVASLIAGISSDQAIVDALWQQTLTDMDAWGDLRLEQNDLKRVGSIEFFEDTAGNARIALRNMIRRRYGLPNLPDAAANRGYPGTVAVRVTADH